MKLKTQELGR